MNAANSFAALKALVRKDLILYFSNRRSLIMSIAAPIAIAAFFGSVFDQTTGRTSPLPVAVADLDGSVLSKKIVAALHADSALAVQDQTEPEAVALVRKGHVRAAIVLPAGFGQQAPNALLGGGTKPVVGLHYDPSQSVMLAMVRGLLAQHVMDAVSRTVFGGTGPASAGGSAASSSGSGSGSGNAGGFAFSVPYVAREVAATAVDARPYNSYAHAFAGMGVQFILFMGVEVGVGVLLARRLGLWKRLRAAPLSRSMLLGSHILSGALIAFTLMCIIYAAAVFGFGVRVGGSVAGFFGVVAAFSLLTSSFGLLIAALGKTPEATRGLAIFATLIMVMLGGAWVPSFIFPQWLQTATLAVPTRWAVDGLDAMTWRGLDFANAAPAIGALLGFSVLFAAVAIWRFDWEEPR